MNIANTKSYKEIESLINVLSNTNAISSNKEEKLFKYDVYDAYNNIVSNLMKRDFEVQNEIEEYDVFFMLFEEKFIILKNNVIKCAEKNKDRTSLFTFLNQFAVRIQAKIDAKGAVVEL